MSDILGYLLVGKSAVFGRFEMGGKHSLITTVILVMGIYGMIVIFMWLGN